MARVHGVRTDGATRRGTGRILSGLAGLLMVVLVAAACVPPPVTPEPTTTTTTAPGSTTTTTEAPASTTTTAPSTTTTTLPEEPDPEPVVDFEQAASLLTDPGQSVDVRLGVFDDTGSPTGEALPVPDYEVLGDVGAFDVTDLDDGGLRVTSTGTVGGIVVSARVPGQELAVTTEIFTARPQPGVQLVQDDRVVFPVPNLPTGIDPVAVRNDDITDDGPGGFSWDELRDRVDMPAGESPDTEAPAAPFLDPGEVYVPFVLRGPAPAAGTRLLSAGGAGLAGEVVERSGLPTVERGGFSLVTVRTASLGDLYGAVNWTIDPEQVVAAGIVPESFGFDQTCAEDVAAEDCAPLADAPIETTVAQPAQPRGGRSAGSASASTTFVAPATTSARAEPAEGECESSWKSSIAQLKFAETKVLLAPKFALSVNLGNDDPSLDRLFFYGGYYFETSSGISGKIQAAFSAAMDCKLKELGHKDFPIPAGPASALLSIRIKAQIVANLGVEVEGGPSLEFKRECVYSHQFQLGFDAKYDPVGGRLGRIDPIHVDEVTRECKFSPTSALGANSAGIAMKVGFEAGIALKVPLGLQIGGKLSGVWQKLLDDPELGFFELANLTIGPRIAVSLENDARALQNRSADSQARVEVMAKAGLGSQAFARLSKGMGLDPSALEERLANIELLSRSIPLLSFYEPLKVDEGHVVDVTVDGESRSGTIEVDPGDELAVSTSIPRPQLGPSPEIESGSVWIQKGLADFDELEAMPLTGSGLSMEGSLGITQAVCDEIGTEPVELLLIGKSVFDPDAALVGKYVPAYGGSITVQCVAPTLEFDRDAVDFRADQTGFPSTVNLKGTALNGDDWTLDPDSLPVWLSATPSNGRFLAESPDTASIVLRVDCTKVDPRGEVSATVKAESLASDAETFVDDTLSVTADCRKAFVEIAPTRIDAGPAGGSFPVTVTSYGPTVVYWPPMTGGFASADHPNSGVLPSGYSTRTVTVTVPEYPEACTPQQPRTSTLSLRTEPRVEGDTIARGSASVTVVQQPPGVKDCDPPPGPGGAWGDPHIVSFDGNRYDAQTFGEYWYAIGGEAGPDLEVQTRHERWTQSGFGSTATIITGVAARVDGHVVEFYRRSAMAPLTKVVVDGRQVTPSADAPLQLGENVTLVTAGSGWQIHAGDVSLEIVAHEPEDYLSVWVSVPHGADVSGLIGTPDGDPANDMVGRDGTVYTLRDLRLHGQQLLDFASSWRVTDLEDSLFSETYAGFDDALSMFDTAALAQYRDDAAAYLDGIEVICATPTGDDLDYAIDSIAVEMMAGTPEETYAQSGCRYRVTGRVTAELPDGEVIPVAGLKLRLSEDRLSPCEVVTSADGGYSCTMAPVPTEDLPAVGGAPVQVDIVATWPGRSGTVQSASTSFDALSPLVGSPAAAAADLRIDAASLVRADASGVLLADLTGDGSMPVTDPTVIGVRALDADGKVLAELVQTVDPTDSGAFSLTRYLPGGTAEVELTARIGTVAADWPRSTFAVEPGANVLGFDVEHRATLVAITGNLTDADDAPLGPTEITVRTSGPGAGDSSSYHQVVPAADGSYRLVVSVPSAATTVTATALVGEYLTDRPSVELVDPVPGLNQMVLSMRYAPPVLRTTGTLLGADGAPRGATAVALTMLRADGSVLGSRWALATPDAAGAYAFDQVLPLGTAQVKLSADVGVVSADDPVQTVTGIAPGINPTTFDVSYDPPRLALSGLLLDGEGTPRATTAVTLRAVAAGGATLHTATVQAQPDPVTGSYVLAPVALPLATARVAVTYRIGPVEADWIQLAVDPLLPGLNERSFDIDERSTTLLVSGRMSTSSSLPLTATQVRARAYDGSTLLGTWSDIVVPSGSGAYAYSREVPRATTRVVLEAHVGVHSSDWVTREVVDLVPGPNQVTFDVEYLPTWADLSGTMVGVDPATGTVKGLAGLQYLDLVMYDAQGAVLSTDSAAVSVSADDGSYGLGLRVPGATAQIRATARIGEHPSEYPTVTRSGFQPGTRTPVVLDVDYRPSVLAVSGTVRVAGSAYVGPVEVKVAERDADGDVVRTRTLSATSGATGAYSVTHVLRLGSTDATVTVIPSWASGTARSVQVADLQPGRRVVPVSIDSSTTVLAASGHLEYFGEPQQGERQLRVRTYDANNDEVELVPGGYFVTVEASGPHGAYSTEIPLREDVRHVNLVAEVDTPDGIVSIASSSFWITPNQQSIAVWNTHGAWVELDATFLDGGAPYTQPFSVDMRASNDDGSTYQIQSGVYPSPDGRTTVGLFVPFDSVAGGDASADPTRVDFTFYGYGDSGSSQHTFVLDRGAGIYRRQATVDVATETRRLHLRVPEWSENSFTLTPVRYPGELGGSFDRFGEIVLDPSKLDGTWNSNEYQYEVDVEVPQAATHLAVRLANGDVERVLDLDSGDTLLFDHQPWGREITLYGRARATTDGTCNAQGGTPVAFRLDASGIFPNPDDPSQLYGYALLEDELVIPRENGEYVYRFWMPYTEVTSVQIYADSEAFDGVDAGSNYRQFDVGEEPTYSDEMDVTPNCGAGRFQASFDALLRGAA